MPFSCSQSDEAGAAADTARAARISVIADARIDAETGCLTADLQTFGVTGGQHSVSLFIEGTNFKKRLDFVVPAVKENATAITVAADCDLNDFIPTGNALNISAETWDGKYIDIVSKISSCRIKSEEESTSENLEETFHGRQ